MAVYYLDTSALAKLYIQEIGSGRVAGLLRDPEHDRFAILEVSRVEFHSAVRRREREGDIASAEAANVLTQLDSNLQDLFLVQPLTAAVLEEAVAIIGRHPLRAYDALQLAGGIALNAGMGVQGFSFVCADDELLDAAMAEGIEVINPNENPGT